MDISEKIKRYNLWRKRQNTDRPLLGLLWEPDIPPLPEFLGDANQTAKFSPEQIQPSLCFSRIEQWHRQELQLDSDVIQPFTPAFGIPWMEAIAGCRVIAKPGSLWAEPFFENYNDRPDIRYDSENPWLKKLLEFSCELTALSNNRFPIAVPQMRGPLDILAAMRTPAQMCLDFIEKPKEVSKILEELTALWIQVGRRVLQEIPPFYGGYCTRMKMWTPGPAITPQNDCSTLISEQFYKEFLSPLDHKIFSSFPYTSFHMHSSEFHQTNNLLSDEALTAIEFTLENSIGGPPLEKMLPVIMKILDKKPLLLACPDAETADICIHELPPAGLCVMIATAESELPEKIKKWVKKYT